MTIDKQKLKALAESMLRDEQGADFTEEEAAAFPQKVRDFESMTTPAVVLALLAEIERIGADRKACWEEFKVQGRQLDQLKAENEELRQSERYSDQIIETRNRLLKSIPACPVHGEDCVPHAQEWVEAARQDAERYRWLRDQCGLVEYKAIAGSIGPGMLPCGEEMQAAIDAAMAKESSHG